MSLPRRLIIQTIIRSTGLATNSPLKRGFDTLRNNGYATHVYPFNIGSGKIELPEIYQGLYIKKVYSGTLVLKYARK